MFTEISCTKITGSKERGMTLVNNSINELLYALNRWSLDGECLVEVVVKFKTQPPLIVCNNVEHMLSGWEAAIGKYFYDLMTKADEK